MSRPKLALRIDMRAFMQSAQTEKRGRLSEIAKWCNVSRAAVNNWLNDSAIPPLALAKIASELNWSPETSAAVMLPQSIQNESKLVKKQAAAIKSIFSVVADFIECPRCGRMPK